MFWFFSSTLSKYQALFAFLIYTIESWSVFYFSHVHYRNVNSFFFFSLMYTIETWSVFYFSNVHYRNVKSIFSSHLHYSKVKRFCCSDVSYRKVKYFSFFSYTSSKREIFLVLPMYTTKIESSFCFSCML